MKYIWEMIVFSLYEEIQCLSFVFQKISSNDNKLIQKVKNIKMLLHNRGNNWQFKRTNYRMDEIIESTISNQVLNYQIHGEMKAIQYHTKPKQAMHILKE